MSNQTIHPPASPPGDTLLETLEALGMTQTELERRTGISIKTINQIIKGKEPVTQKTALALEKVLKVPASFWLNLDNRYRQYLARVAEEKELAKHAKWVSTHFKYQDLVSAGFVAATTKAGDKVANLLNFFSISEPAAWQQVYGEMHLELSYRKSATVSQKLGSLSAWLRKGEIEAENLELPEYDQEKFKQTIQEIRTLTKEVPSRFKPEMEDLCRQAGVIYRLIPELPGMGISGIMRWYRGRPMIQQTLRLKGNDQFWFTFFHEAKHVLQKRKKEIFLEGQSADHEDQNRENEANRFARELLIPTEAWTPFLAKHPQPTSADIKRFAQQIDIHPGIVVGRLMREKIIHYSHPAQNLIVKFIWA